MLMASFLTRLTRQCKRPNHAAVSHPGYFIEGSLREWAKVGTLIGFDCSKILRMNKQAEHWHFERKKGRFNYQVIQDLGRITFFAKPFGFSPILFVNC